MQHLRISKPLLSPESALASEIFDQFVSASTFKSILALYREMCQTLRMKPSNFPAFYVKLKSKLRSWKAASLWSKLDKRASHKCYNRGKSASGTRVLIIGGGPCGLRMAIEAQLLGAKVVVVEKRDRFSRNNVLHLWPFVIHDLRNLGAKKFYGKFCAGSIDHISIRQLQCILLKVALLLGVEVHENVAFESLLEPPLDQNKEKIGWRAKVKPADHPVTNYEFNVLLGADGKRNTLSGFKKKEFRGKLAIAITANFLNKRSLEEARVEEISGVAFIFNQKFFHDLRAVTDIDLENIVYYKDETHYFVMTAKKHSLIYKGVILNDYPDTVRLLSPDNVDREALMAYAREAADFSTDYQLPHLDFAVNHYGQPDIAMFDFTSMYAAENASQIIERRGHQLLLGLVGDTLIEPFWPTGSGCARGFLSVFDAGWMIRGFASGKLTALQVLAERECVYRLLAQTTPENLNKDFNAYNLNPGSRYPNLNVQAARPGAVKLLFDSDVPVTDRPSEIILPDISSTLTEEVTLNEEVPAKRKKDSEMNREMLLSWCQRQVTLYDVRIRDFTNSWKDGVALGSIVHRFRPDLINVESLQSENVEQNNNLVFGILEKDYNIPPVMTGKEMAECETLDELTLISYISQVYNAFKGEIPYFVRDKQQSSPADKELSGITTPITTSHRKTSSGSSSRPSVINKSSSKTNRVHQKRQSLDKHKHAGVELQKRSRQSSSGSNKRRSTDRTQAAQLYPYQEQRKSSALALSKRKLSPLGPKLQTNSAQFQDRCKFLEDKIRHDFGMITREERQTIEDEAWKKKKPPMPISKLEREQWNIKMLEDKLKILKDGKLTEREKQYAIDGSRLTQEVFNHKFQSMDAKLKSGGRDIEGEKRYDKFDSRLKALDKKLKVGPNLDVGVRGSNKVSLMASQLSRSAPDSQPPLSPLSKSASSKSVYLGLGVHGSEVCYFCKERVYLMERMSAEGMFFHRGCFKCEYCGTALRLGGYAFDRNVPFGGKFYCQTHYGMQRVERPVYTRHVINKASTGGSTPDLSSRNNKNAKSPGRRISGPRDSSLTAAILAEEQKSRLNVASTRVSSGEIDSRGLTPERAEFENSYADMTSEDELSELDEDEWTERNFGSSVEQDTSDDEYSDLSTDTESDESLEEEVERSMTVDETRRLAERWKRRYSQETLVDVSGATDESDTETDTGGESDVFSSEEEYRQSKHTAENNGRPQETECQFDNRRNVDGEMSDSLHSDDYTTYTDTETEEEQPVVRHEIPEIVIEEMLSKPLNSDEEHLVPEAVEAFQAANKSFDVSPQEVPEVSSVENGNVKEICVRVRSPVSPTDQSDINKSIAEIDDVVKDLIRQSDAYKENIELIKSKETSSTLTSVPEDSFGNRLPIGREADIGSGVEKNVPEDGSNRFKPPNHERSRLGLAKSKCRDDERRHTSPVSLRDITRAKEEFLNCGGSDLKKRSSSPVKKDALFKTLKSIEQLQRVLESPPSQDQISASRESLDRLKRTERSLSPPVKRQPLSLFNSRFKTGMGDKSGEGFAQKRNFILSKTASTSCVPSVKNMAPNNFGLMKTASTSDVPFYRLSAIGASDGILKEAEDEQLSKDRNSSGKGEPVGSLYGDSKVKQGDVDLLNKTSEADATCKKTQNLLSPVKAKHNDIMLDSESMSSNSTLNELEIDAIADRISSNPSGKHSSPAKLSGVSAGGKSERVNAVLPIIEVQYDKDADDFSGSEWAHEELASTFEDDFSDEFNQNPFVTVRDRRKKNLRRFSWEDDEPAVPVQNNKLFHTAFVQSIVLDDDFDVTPPNGIDFEEMAENEPAYSSNTLSRSSGRLSADQSVKSSEKSVDTNSLLSNGASDENLLNNCDKKLSESTPLISSNDEFGAGERKNDDSSDSTYKTPDSTTKYKGYTGNFARKVSPFGSILDSVIRRRENLESNGRTATVKENEKPVPSKVDESAENDKNLKTEQAGVLKKLNVEPFVKNDKKIYRRKSINGDTPKNSAEEDMFYTPMTSRKGTPDQRPWSVCGTPTETRKVIVTTGNATPTNAGYTKDFRFLTTVEREKRREQARQRARLKSDEELGILPSNYSRRKYRNRTGSLSEEPEAVAEQDSIGDLHRETTFNSDALETSHISLGSLGEFKSHENLREPIDETICDMQAINHGGADVHEVVNKNSDLEANQNCVGSCGVEDLKPDEVASLDVDSGGINTKMADVASNSSDSMRENDSPELTTGKIADSKIEGDSLLPSVAMNENIGVEQENAGCKKTEACHLSDIKSGECAAQMTNSVSSLMSSSVSDQDCGKQAPKTPNTSLGSLAEIKSDGANDGSRSNTLDGDKKKKSKKKKDEVGDGDKPQKRKSIFAMLSLAKSGESTKKKDQEKSSTPAMSGESNPSTPKNSGRERSFLKNIRLSRSKEKFREKKKECDRGEALVPEVSPDDVTTAAIAGESREEVGNVNLVKCSDPFNNTSPPRASDDSFTESESNSQQFALTAEQLLNRSELTEKIVAESLLCRKSTKDKETVEDRQQKLQKIAKKVQKQQEWKRNRLAQEIQRSLEELDVKRRQLEQHGVELEKALRKQDSKKEKDPQIMNDWLNMVHRKNKLNNEEQDLLIRLKELQLEDKHSKLQRELRTRMAVNDSLKDKSEIGDERKILKEMLEIVEERDALVEILEENRLKQEKADKDFQSMMDAKVAKKAVKM